MKKILVLAATLIFVVAMTGCDLLFPPPQPQRYITYTADLDGDSELYVLNLDAASADTTGDQLTDNDIDDWEPRWSPDKSEILYEVEYDDGSFGIFVVSADGGNRTNLSINATESETHAAYTPDGTKIVFATPDSADVWIMNRDGTGRTKIIEGIAGPHHMDVSPDGTQIAYTDDWKIYTANIDGTNNTVLADGTSYLGWPRWSPDGNTIAFFGIYDDSVADTQIYTISVSNQIVTQLTVGTDDHCCPNWIQDGERITFARKTGDWVRYYDMNADGTDTTLLLDTTGLIVGFEIAEK